MGSGHCSSPAGPGPVAVLGSAPVPAPDPVPVPVPERVLCRLLLFHGIERVYPMTCEMPSKRRYSGTPEYSRSAPSERCAGRTGTCLRGHWSFPQVLYAPVGLWSAYSDRTGAAGCSSDPFHPWLGRCQRFYDGVG
jgi:hypothetical protein